MCDLVNHTRFPKEDHLPDWACRDYQVKKGDHVKYNDQCSAVSSASACTSQSKHSISIIKIVSLTRAHTTQYRWLPWQSWCDSLTPKILYKVEISCQTEESVLISGEQIFGRIRVIAVLWSVYSNFWCRSVVRDFIKYDKWFGKWNSGQIWTLHFVFNLRRSHKKQKPWNWKRNFRSVYIY